MNWPEFQDADEPLEVISKISRYYGDGVEFVIAGGGNTSYKADNKLWIKASGTSLRTVQPGEFVELERAILDDALTADFGDEPTAREAQYKDVLNAARIHPERGQRASVESLMHHAIPATYVVHTHSTVMNKLTCAVNGEHLAESLYGDDVIWIPFVDPGFILSKVIGEAMRAYKGRTGRDLPRAIVMQNHGIIVAGDTPEQIRTDTDWLLNTFSDFMGQTTTVINVRILLDESGDTEVVNTLSPMLRVLLAEDTDAGKLPKIVLFSGTDIVREFVSDDAAAAMAGDGPLSPDQIVYCKSFPMWLEFDRDLGDDALVALLRAAIAEHRETTGFPPKVVLLKDVGLFTIGDDYKGAETTSLVYTDAIKIMLAARVLGGVNYLSERDRTFIDNWEVEQFRRKVAAAAGPKGRLSQRVAVVTGAAQGFGNGIAKELAAEGAHVVLLDVNEDGVKQSAAELSATFGHGRSIGLAADVTDTESMAAAIHQTVQHYGGVDLFISNAGVLRAGSVLDLSPEDFDFVTNVNYKGYFVCVQAVTPVMALQNRAAPELMTDIIQINSKSGLVGSNRNAAYAGSKFGAIGLTQSFALELIESGIKVNAVCPGNFFDGPLWSDPENGLFVQYLNTGKVPGAKTIEDVKASYEAKVPMGRGCLVPDVVRAILYLVDQQYETGQALPVTGGQVMLS
jgi:NAD(P)-dependent dehydrogenase (short-subunit alcohol dehydrogenase family)/rhamnose utilization protein RhaD (predicted bifunctional aldolase and dehydrogenase)